MSTYGDGELNGKQLSYHENGQISLEEAYRHGRPDGTQLRFYENGQVKVKNFYNSGQKAGRSIYYKEDGGILDLQSQKDATGIFQGEERPENKVVVFAKPLTKFNDD